MVTGRRVARCIPGRISSVGITIECIVPTGPVVTIITWDTIEHSRPIHTCAGPDKSPYRIAFLIILDRVFKILLEKIREINCYLGPIGVYVGGRVQQIKGGYPVFAGAPVLVMSILINEI